MIITNNLVTISRWCLSVEDVNVFLTSSLGDKHSVIPLRRTGREATHLHISVSPFLRVRFTAALGGTSDVECRCRSIYCS